MNLKNKIFINLILMTVLLFTGFVNAEEIDIELISNVSLLASNNYGCEGGTPLDPSRTYLFAGDQILFSVSVEIDSGIENIESVGVYVNEGLKVHCYSLGNSSPTKEEYGCLLTIEDSWYMHGESIIEAKAKSVNDNEDSVFIGNWFLNPYIQINSDTDRIFFPDANGGEIVYSEEITIINSAEGEVPLNISLSGVDLYSLDPDAQCPIDNYLSLANLAYYAENGIYSTIDDPRADEEGYIEVQYGPDFIYYFEELILGHSLLDSNNEIKMKLRSKVPKICEGDFTEGYVITWGKAECGPHAGTMIDLNFNSISSLMLDFIEGIHVPLP